MGSITGQMHLDRRAEAIVESGRQRADDDLIDEQELARWLGVSRQFVQQQRTRETGPRFIRMGATRMIRYKVSDVRAWLESRTLLMTEGYRRKPKKIERRTLKVP